MDNSVSSLVSTLGGGSGVDMVKLASDLAAARFAPRIEQLEARNETLEARVSSASQLRSQLSQLASALGDRIRTGDLAPSATIGNAFVADPSVLIGSNPQGSFSLEVTQLAAQQNLVMPPYASADDLVGEGTLTLRFGEIVGTVFNADSSRASIDIDVTASDTLATLSAKINASGAGITTYVANGQNGAHLMLKGAEGGANGFILEANGSAGTVQPGELSYLAWDPTNDSGQLRQSAKDASFLLDTISMTSPSNHVTNLPQGLQLNLMGTNTGAPTTIGFSDRSDQISAVMSDFVIALNDLAQQVSESAAALGGELGNDPGAREFKRALAGLTNEIVMPNATDDQPRTLGDLGLSVNRDGTFRLDNERLQRTLAENAAGASAMFTVGIFGVFATIDSLSRRMSTSADPGSLAGSIARYTGQIERNSENLADIAEQQDALRERMTKTFSDADRNIAQSNSTLSFLRAQIDIWNGQNN